MDRLTNVMESGEIIVGKRFMVGLDTIPRKTERECYKQLAEYENTGLTPQEVEQLRQDKSEREKQTEKILAKGCTRVGDTCPIYSNYYKLLQENKEREENKPLTIEEEAYLNAKDTAEYFAKQEENPPLTLEELNYMQGECVYCVSSNKITPLLILKTSIVHISFLTTEHDHDDKYLMWKKIEELNKRYKLYRHKPKGV